MFAQVFPTDLNDIIFSRQRLRRVEGRVSLPAAITVTDSGWVTVAQLELPQTDVGFITGYANMVVDPSWDYNGAILFSVLVNSSPVDDCGSFSEQRGTLPNLAEALYYVPAGGRIVLRTRRAVLGTSPRDVVMGATIITWNQTQAPQFLQAKQFNPGGRRLTP